MAIRTAQLHDVERMAELADLKRTECERFSPTFWRKAEGAKDGQITFFRTLLERPKVIALVWDEGGVEGFIIGSVVPPPPVYDPGKNVCVVDDFVVSNSERWSTVGVALLDAVREKGEGLEARLSVVVCGHLDEPKRAMLRENGFAIASEWYVNPA
ncbi:MAG: hypothetical protein AVDCRST_MAG86-1359 [uncultured Truepera sp.]|uniref:N-acetyltransferase domain-containing protein n=1 Tax=uncultured Truepera sp. TaxID=543023 RepID=A0A6J4V608_9DEIN|nr:MAG: hypothetical protein AVDCRST_MAG86-1359 [uncultured Truepera sp.]